MSLRNGEICPMCNSRVVGLFPYVAMACANTGGTVTLNQMVATMYTCGDCGWIELYMQTPVTKWKKTPAEHEMVFSWHRPPPPADGPYR